MSSQIVPFTLAVPQAELDDLNARLANTRWPDEPAGSGWSLGVPQPYLRELVDYWRDGYDWRAVEARINKVPQFTTELDGQQVHFIHARSPEPNATPLLLTHGWGGSIVEFLDLIGPLTDPAAYGGDATDAFHVVIPTIPGFGLSGPTRELGWTIKRVAAAWLELMARLGYDRFVAHGGDFGSITTRELGIQAPDRVRAIHVTGLFDAGASAETADQAHPDPEEQRSVVAGYRYEYELGGYSTIQSTRPHLIGLGLTDSPAFLLAWLADGLHAWTSARESAEVAVSRDTLLTNVMFYWLNRTAFSSVRYYAEGMPAWGEPEQPSLVPTAVAVFPDDIFVPIRRIAEQNNNVNLVRWTRFEAGGHFPGLEQPALLIDDLRAAFRDYRAPGVGMPVPTTAGA